MNFKIFSVSSSRCVQEKSGRDATIEEMTALTPDPPQDDTPSERKTHLRSVRNFFLGSVRNSSERKIYLRSVRNSYLNSARNSYSENARNIFPKSPWVRVMNEGMWSTVCQIVRMKVTFTMQIFYSIF